MSDVVNLVGSRVDEDPTLSDGAKLLVLAALEGDEALADMAGFTRPEPPVEAGGGSTVEPAGAFLKQIWVRGFRGIGAVAQLDLKPGPGLTVVAGRNGSGKSSFSDALEVALTGTTYRWLNKRSKQWQEAWRNLHEPTAPRLEVTLAEEVAGHTRITVEWPPDSGLDDMVTSLQRHGKKKQVGISSLGWSGPLETYRPLLTYDELGALLGSEPSKLYDALSTVLGLEQIADALKRLNARSKDLAQSGTHVAQSKKSLMQSLGQIEDERAERALALLNARALDAAGIRSLATGTSADGSQTSQRLRAVLQLALPDTDEVESVAMRLRDSVSRLAAAGDATSQALERRTAILSAALTAHTHDGDMPCPVCGQGTLDASRAEQLRREVDEAGEFLRRLRKARGELDDARRAAAALVAATPSSLASEVPEDLEGLRTRAVEAWSTWAETPPDDLGLADHLTANHSATTAALVDLQRAARVAVAARDDAWTAVASQLAAFADEAQAWETIKPQSDDAKVALRWLKDNDVALKNERVKPIADQAAAIWADLRQESNVDIAGLTLEGAATRRRVAIAASVDGKDAGGMAVLSQGELHALALALFLPRATMPESPFRFVVLDDPVQAMDPAKVDGLVTVLAAIAQSRQVVVFSHDDRLASAVRRAEVDATILEVTRGAGSKVQVQTTFDPASRYLRDAFSLARDDGLPEPTLRRVLPGMLRFAAEAQARDCFFARALAAGRRHADVEGEWTETHKTGARVSLALYGEVRSLDAWLARAGHRRTALGICTSAVHAGLCGDPTQACRDIEKLLADIKAGSR